MDKRKKSNLYLPAVIFVAMLLGVFIQPAWAQDSGAEIEELRAENGDEVVSPRTATLYLDRCLAKIPRKFTPSSHEDYCYCTAAMMRQNITNNELAELDEPNAKKPGNAAFEKYVDQVMMPCMGDAVVDIAYVECIEDRSNSPLIYHIPKYCQCVGVSLVPFVERAGTSTAMTRMAQYPNDFREPIDALLRSTEFIRQKNAAYDSCKSRYMKTQLPNVKAYP